MDTNIFIPIIKYLPPVDGVFYTVRYDLHKLIRALDSIAEGYDIDFSEILCNIDRYVRKQNVQFLAIFGSFVYRMTNREEVSDIDIMIVHDGSYIFRSNSKPYMDVITLTEKDLTNPGLFELGLVGGGLLIFKDNERIRRQVKQMRKLFLEKHEEVLLDIASRDVMKEINSKRILKYLEDKTLISKIDEVPHLIYKDPTDIFHHPGPKYVKIVLSHHRFSDNEIAKLYDAVLKRRRVQKEVRSRLIKKIMNI